MYNITLDEFMLAFPNFVSMDEYDKEEDLIKIEEYGYHNDDTNHTN